MKAHASDGLTRAADSASAAGIPATGRPQRQVGPVRRVASAELLCDGAELIIVHAGREYRLRVTSNGKLILTA